MISTISYLQTSLFPYYLHLAKNYFSTVVKGNPAEEKRIVEDELQQLTACSSSSFWSNLERSRVLLTLRTRVKQMGGVMGSCHAALCNIFSALFPLNNQPEGIFTLLKEFSSYNKAKKLVRHQLIGGAKFALAVAKTHYPRIDYSLIARGPKTGPNRQHIIMIERYEAAAPAAFALVRQAEEETEAELARNRVLPG